MRRSHFRRARKATNRPMLVTKRSFNDPYESASKTRTDDCLNESCYKVYHPLLRELAAILPMPKTWDWLRVCNVTRRCPVSQPQEATTKTSPSQHGRLCWVTGVSVRQDRVYSIPCIYIYMYNTYNILVVYIPQRCIHVSMYLCLSSLSMFTSLCA